jgi:thiol-disulfide isomerase/thioredoxin
MMKKTWSFLFLMLIFASFKTHAKGQLKDGPWRFEYKTNYALVPFIIDFKLKGGRLSGVLENGKEKIVLDNISYVKDQIFINIQAYELRMELKVQTPKHITGEMIRLNKNPKVSNAVNGVQGIKVRYPGDRIKYSVLFDGKWAVTLTEDNDTKSQGVLLFNQNGNDLSGSLLTPTGDYRYFDGYISDNTFEVASFDGVYNYVIRGKVNKGILEATLLSNSQTKIKGVADPKASLPDPYSQTKVGKLKFIFPTVKGKMVNLQNPKFKNKPLIIQIFGSWCPNCLDEMNYLVPWYNENSKRGIEIIALAFERSLSHDDAQYQLAKTIAKFQIPYTVLIAGATAEDKPAQKLPMIKNFISFPTTIFLNRNHEVVKVHAGFSGPSTGSYYEEWKQDFKHLTDELLK